jgi:putative selenate reductase
MIVEEKEKRGTIFGLSKDQFFVPSSTDPYKVQVDGSVQETPIGVAAGPHTQMSQNIISAWLTGARHIELKTVQYNDRIEVTKPCIDMEDEGYNCEWSQELRIEDSFNQYLDAWILIHLLRDRFKWNKNNEKGFIFNVSIGYDLQSILSKKIQWFLDKYDNCAADIEKKREKLLKCYPEVKEIVIPERMSNSFTLSLMHGSPPEEIERIGHYLIEERKFNTSIKLNPTLLGMSMLRKILNEKLGYRVIVPDAAFKHDLKYDDALKIIDSLKSISKKNNVSFRIKLTNTLETINLRKTLPEKEEIIYMSGRALHPIAINLAAKLQSDFKGELDISFAGGVDYLNICDVIACGMAPVTVCTDILKPGGYHRLLQYLEKIEIELEKFKASNICEYIKSKAGNKKDDLNTAALKNLKTYAEKSIEQKYYKKEFFPDKNIKRDRKLTYFDCISAPCVEQCATDQNIPEYLYLTSRRDYREALQTILKTNAFPSVTALICDHLCQQRCTRINYDNPIMIKDIKRFISEKSRFKELKNRVNKKISTKVAIIGAGPSGLSCAYFLILEGFQVEVFEARSFAGGMLSYVIPEFRLPAEKIARDINRIEELGVKIHYNTNVHKQLFEKLKREYDFIYISSGAQKSKRLWIEGEESNRVTDALTFLSQIKRGENISHGKDIAIVGGGNSAIDAARTALMTNKNRGNVTIIYRRSRNEMPADKDEVAAAFSEGIGLLELTALSSIKEVNEKIKLQCCKMRLGEMDETSRPKPFKIEGSEFELVFDFLIYAVGQNIDIDFFKKNNKENKNIFIGGDAFRGSSTLINAVGDGKKCAEKIIKAAKKKKILKNVNIKKELSHSDLIKMRKKKQ